MGQLIRNILSSYAVRVIAIAVDFFMLPFLSAWLGMEELGAFLLVRNAVALFLQSDLGMGASTIRYVAVSRATSPKHTINDVSNTSLAFFLLVGLIATPIFVLGMRQFWARFADAPLTTEIQAAIVVAAVGNVFLGLLWLFIKNILIGVQRYDAANALQIGQSLLRAFGTVGLIYWGKGLVGAVLAEALSIGIVILVGYIMLKAIVPELKLNMLSARWPLLKEMLPYSTQMAVMGFLAFTIVQSGPLIAGATVSVALVGVYTAALRIYLALKDLTSSLVQPLFPMAAFARTEGQENRLRTILVRGTQVSNAVSLAFVIPTALFMDELIGAWLGPAFSQAGTTALILLAGLMVNNNHLVSVSLLQGVGKVKTVLSLHAVWASSTVILGVWLASYWGINGIALGMVLPLFFLEALYVRASLREFKVSAGEFVSTAMLAPGITAAGLMIILTLWYRSVAPLGIVPVILFSLVFSGLYLGVVFMLVTDKGERLKIRSLLGSRVARGRG